MIVNSRAERATYSSCSSRKRESRGKPGICPLPGFLPTSAESIRLALSLSLHGMPHDRVFGVYKEGYYTLINAYLWDLCRFNHLIDSFSAHLLISSISVESFSTGLVSFIKISDTVYTLLDFLLLSDNQELHDNICAHYKEKCTQQDLNLYSYELHVRDISQRYIACIDSEMRDGLIKQKNRYKTAYTRLLEMYSEDIAAINRILGNIGAHFITDRNILGPAGISPAILTSRLLSFVKKSPSHNDPSSPVAVPPTLDFRSFDDVFPSTGSRSPVPRGHYSPVSRARTTHQERGSSSRSSTSYTAQRDRDDGESRHFRQDPIQQKNNLFNIRAELTEIMTSTDTYVHEDQRRHRANPRPSTSDFFIRNGGDFEAQHLHDNLSIAEIHGIDIGLQTGTNPSLTATDAVVWTVPNNANDQAINTDMQLQLDAQVQVEIVAQVDAEIQTEAVVICSMCDLHTALQSKTGLHDSITLTYTLLEHLLEQAYESEKQIMSSGDLYEDVAIQTSTQEDNDELPEQESSEEADNIVMSFDLPAAVLADKHPHPKLGPSTSAVLQTRPLENQHMAHVHNKDEPLTEQEILWKQKFDPYLTRFSFAQGFSQEISDGESSLQPIFDTCDQSSLIMPTDGVVGTAILSFSRSFPEFVYDTLTSNSSEFHTSQSQLQTAGEAQPAGAPEALQLRHVSRLSEERSYEAQYNSLLSKYMLMEEQSLKQTLETEELQAKVDILTEEAESLRVELQRLKDGYTDDALNNYGMIVQGSISENEDLSKDRYAANSRIERTAVVEELKQQDKQSQLLGQGTDSADFLLSANLIESGKHLDSEPYNDASEKIVCSVIRNDIITGSHDDNALAESVIAIQTQNTDGGDAPNKANILLRQLDALERQEQALLARLNQVSEESQAKTELNRNMQSMLSTIGLTVSTQLSDMEQLSTLVDSIEQNAFSLRPEIRKIQSYLSKTASVSSHLSSSASFIDCLDD